MAYRTTSWKNTDIGKIPSDWSITNLSDICDNYTGLTYSPKSVSESGTLVLRSSNIKQGRLSFSDNVFVKMEIPSRAMAHDGDVLVCVRNGSTRLIGKSAKVVGNGMAFGAFMTVLRANKCFPEFLLFLWQSFYIQEQIKITLGATINQITNADIKNFVVPVPSTIPEQQKIAEVLTDIDDLIAELECVMDKKNAIKTGAMQELLKPKASWKTVLLSQIADIYQPETISQNVLTDSGYTVYGANGIIGCYSKYNHADPQIMITCRGSTCGTVNKSRPYSWITGNAMVVKTNDTVSKDFLYYLLSNVDFSFAISGSGQPQIVRKPLIEFNVCIPSCLQEQEKIAQTLSDMDDEISAISEKINKYKQIKSGVAGELLSGRIRLVKPQE